MWFWNGQLLRPGSSRQLFESWIIIIIFLIIGVVFCWILLNEMKKVKVWSRGSLLRLFSAVLHFACADYFSCRHLCSQTSTYTFTHKTIHASLTSQKNKIKSKNIKYWKIIKKIIFFFFFILQTGEVTQSATNNNIFFYTFVFTSCSSSSVLYLSTLSSVLGLNSFLVDYLTDDGGEVGGEKEHTKLPLGLWSIEHNNNNNDLKKKKKKKKK